MSDTLQNLSKKTPTNSRAVLTLLGLIILITSGLAFAIGATIAVQELNSLYPDFEVVNEHTITMLAGSFGFFVGLIMTCAGCIVEAIYRAGAERG